MRRRENGGRRGLSLVLALTILAGFLPAATAIDISATRINTADVTLRVQPEGYPERSYPCREEDIIDPDTGDVIGTQHIHGEDHTWSEVFALEISLFIEYKFSEHGERKRSMLIVRGGLSDSIINDMLRDFNNGSSVNEIMGNYKPDYEDILLDYECGDPVNMVDGNYTNTYADLRMEGAYPLSFVRGYNSRNYGGSLGQGFSHGYDFSLADDTPSRSPNRIASALNSFVYFVPIFIHPLVLFIIDKGVRFYCTTPHRPHELHYHNHL